MLRILKNFANEIDLANAELSDSSSQPILVQRGAEPIVDLQMGELEVIIYFVVFVGSSFQLLLMSSNRQLHYHNKLLAYSSIKLYCRIRAHKSTENYFE